MGDEPSIIDAGPAIPRAWALVLGTFLALASLAWLAVILLPTLRLQPGLGTVLAVLGIALFFAGLSQVLLGLRSGAGRNRRLILLNGGFALAVPLSALVHNALAAVSGGAIEEPIFLLATVFLPTAVIATSFLLCLRALLNSTAARGQPRSRREGWGRKRTETDI